MSAVIWAGVRVDEAVIAGTALARRPAILVPPGVDIAAGSLVALDASRSAVVTARVAHRGKHVLWTLELQEVEA